MPLDLAARDFATPWFDLVSSGKAKTRVISSHFDDQRLVLADYAGNVWAVDAATGKKQGATKCKHGLHFGFHLVDGQLLAFNRHGLVCLSPDTGDMETLLTFQYVHSPVRINNRFYLFECSARGRNTIALLQVTPGTLETKVLYKEHKARQVGCDVHTREIAAWPDDQVLFFGDGQLRSCHVPTGTVSPVVEETYNALAGLHTVGEHAFFIVYLDSERNPSLRAHPHFQRMLHLCGTGPVDVVESEEQFRGSLYYLGSSQPTGNGEAIASFGGLVFQIKDRQVRQIGKLIGDDEFPRLPLRAESVQVGKRTYLFFGTSYGDHAEETGFVLCTVDADGVLTRQQHYVSGKLGKNFGVDIMQAHGNHVVVCGDGYYHLLRLK